ncbi:dipeptidase [Benzoatithermus flavus]|uniref:Dipeptidase n=1 Tax=Benzoatithermus flavus TaxID=3108223 RepID=A0ABU8XY76_9PROT
MPDTAPVLRHIEETFAQSVARLQDLLRFPSVGVDPRHEADTKACARWLADRLAEIGMEASVRPTEGMPMVVAHDRSAPEGAPHLLYYGHYDVQPADPIELWETPPFEPTIVEGPRGPRVVARGAVDDKGQIMTFIEAMRAWKAVHGALPVRVTIFLEGEEEASSRSLEPFLLANRDELRADVCVISDTGMLDVDRPAITYMLRGLAYAEVTLHGPSHDLHSGMYGGAVVNPINALCRILAELHDDEGRVQIPGFYDDVREIAPEEAEAWRNIGFDEAAFLAGAGLRSSTGEAGRSVLERVWSRPTCDINGIWGGYTGEGSKTIIASKASAKLSCRLVPDQDPARIMAALKRFFAARTPAGCRLDFVDMGVGGAIRVPTDSPFLDAAKQAAHEVFGVAPVLIGCGGSIPVVAAVKRILGLDTLLVGFGLDDDRVHSPNEKFELVCYRRGIETHAAMLGRFADVRA